MIPTRQVVLDTETTGLEFTQGHRIIEIGCVELYGRRLTGNTFHTFVNPERSIDVGALEVHGITEEALLGEPKFSDIADDLLELIRNSELIIHNADFDIGFINNELSLIDTNVSHIEEICTIQDTLQLARHLHPGQRNSLDALCKRYDIDNSHRKLHGAMLDAEILVEVYLAMTGGQTELSFSNTSFDNRDRESFDFEEPDEAVRFKSHVIRPTQDELILHEKWLEMLNKQNLHKK